MGHDMIEEIKPTDDLRHNAWRYREITKPTESRLKMDDSVAAPRILNMAAQSAKRGHNVDQLSTMGSVFVKKQSSRQTVNPKCPLPLFWNNSYCSYSVIIHIMCTVRGQDTLHN